MYRLKILGHQVGVLARHLQAGMPQHFLEMEHAPTTPKVVDSKNCLCGVWGWPSQNCISNSSQLRFWLRVRCPHTRRSQNSRTWDREPRQSL